MLRWQTDDYYIQYTLYGQNSKFKGAELDSKLMNIHNVS